MKNQTWKTAIWNLSWKDLDTNKYNAEGNCSFHETKGAHLSIPFGDLNRTRELEETGRYIETIETRKYPYLYGITQDGVRLVLCNAASVGSGFHSSGGSFENIKATTVLSAKYNIEPTELITSIDFELEWLKEWFGVTFHHKDNESLSINFNEQRKSILLSESQDSKIELRYGLDYPQNSVKQITIPYYCYLHLEYPNGLTLDEIWNTDIWNLRAMFAFFFGAYPSYIWADAHYKNNKLPVNIFRASTAANQNKKITNRCPVTFSSFMITKLPGIWRIWQNFNKDERYASQVLTSLLSNWEMPLDLMFTASTIMLESLARSNSKDCLTDDEFKRLTKPILKAADTSIKDRLRGLLGLLKHPSYSMLLDAIYEEGKPWSKNLIKDWKTFRNNQISLRHSGAHGVKNNDGHSLVYDHYQAQLILAYIVLLKRLGFTKEQIDQFENSNFMNVSRWNIKQRYKE